jgi:hypothetical protein
MGTIMAIKISNFQLFLDLFAVKHAAFQEIAETGIGF